MTEDEALRTLQAIEVNILNAIADLCAEEGITWWLSDGTCRGAMRHKGFIPWDDDIDIAMLRSDFDRFCEIAPEKLPQGYSFHDSCNTPGHAAMFAKVYRDGTFFDNQEGRDAGTKMGIFVDVFPYDCLYEDAGLRAKQIKVALTAQRRSYLYHSGNITVPHRGILGFIEKTGCRVLHVIERARCKDPREYQRIFNSAITDETLGAASDECLSLAWPVINPIPVDEILPTSEAEFEGARYPVPRLVEKYLTNVYGDWRALPALEDRHTHLPLRIDFGNGEIWEPGK